MASILITGATSGLGLAAARELAARSDLVIAGRDRDRIARAAAEIGARPVHLDLASLASVRAAGDELPDVEAVVCNAGLQFPGALRTTPDGFEETFQVNHLGHLALVDALAARERPPARYVFIGSGTHDPAQRTGMPDPIDDVEAASRGETGDDGAAGRRRYTTSKLLVTAAAGGLARELPDAHVVCFDPGLMTATGLARDYPAPVRRIWAALGRAFALLPFASTPERSGAQLARIAAGDPPVARSGSTIGYDGRPAQVSERACDPAYQDRVLAVTRRLIAGVTPPAAAARA